MNRISHQQLLIVGMACAVAFMFHKVRTIDYDRHAEVVAQTSELNALNAVLIEHVLEARMGLLRQYDPIVDTIQRMKDLVHQIVQTTGAGHEGRAVERAAEAYAGVLQQQEEFVEQFKSQNAVLRNSLAYFPTAAKRLRTRAADTPSREIVPIVNGLLENVLIYSLNGDEASRSNLQRCSQQLASLKDGLDPDLARHVDDCRAHAIRIADGYEQVTELLDRITGVPANEHIDAVFVAHAQPYALAVREANFYRLGLYGLCTALVVYGAWAVIALRRTLAKLHDLNASLEERIGRRTQELHGRNRELEATHVQIEESRKHLEQSNADLARANAQLERRNVELDEFTYVASHDLQEPLRKLTSFSNLLIMDAGGDLPEKAQKDIGFITDAAARMRQLIQDLLQLSRAGRSAMKQEPLSLDECADRALEALSIVIEETAAEIVRVPLPSVVGDMTMLTQLYQNLISNALKFRTKDRRPVIHLTAEPCPSGWCLGVRDNGIGIDEKYAEQIFVAFKRLHGRGEYEGSGIGLSICRKTVERHGGDISVTSEPGVGTNFTFTIPAPQEAVSWPQDPNSTSSSSSTLIPMTGS